MIEIKHVREHVEVFQDGKFLFSEDTESDARKELKEIEENTCKDEKSMV